MEFLQEKDWCCFHPKETYVILSERSETKNLRLLLYKSLCGMDKGFVCIFAEGPTQKALNTSNV